MTRLSVILLISVFLFACHSANRKPDDHIVSNLKTPDTVVPFAGFWLNETYVKKIEHTRSPLESQHASANCCLFIPASTLQPASMASNLHEGGPDMVIVKKDNSFQFFHKENDTVSHLAYDIQIISANKLKVGKQTFIKTNENFLADILFSGEYKDTIGTTIQFSKDGHITGLGTYSVYDVVYDYLGPGMEVDLIDMGQNPKNMEQFGFKFDQDTLTIHKLNCLETDSTDNSCLEVSLGDIKYKLIRVH
ncbi:MULTISPECIES: hypothetical protein [Niastella]|uniref:Lipocalin-like domain-containing protein n=1 Tax=Niastella soli TaxID=2821487 RepID=A0ABS3Z0U0_9BACT|nr:hypothetical protein [Niastella soli]MBO9203709.1 hypothetical protein [Niastella soli]